jgi:hypothetical protein
MKLFQNTQVRFFLFSAVIAGIVLLIQLVLPEWIHFKIWNIYFFILILSLLLGILSSFLLKSFSENFFNIVILGMVIRFIASLVFITVSIWPTLPNIIPFIANFFVIFLFYLVFDIYAFLSNLRPISK